MAISLDIAPLSPVMGAEIRGLDLAGPLSAATFEAVRDAFRRYLLLVFPGQQLSNEDHIGFSRRFGELQVHVLEQYRHPEHPEIYVLSNVDRTTGRTIGEHPDKGTLAWHSDLSFQRRPAQATLLYGREVPAEGGDTLFANMVAAYDALPEAMRAQIDGLRAIHDLDRSRQRMGAPPMTEAQRREAPPIDHPLVRHLPDHGRRSLFASGHAATIAGWDPAAGEALLANLMAHATDERFLYRHRWRANDLVMWDNRCTMHRATGYDTSGARRVMQRTVVLGEIPA